MLGRHRRGWVTAIAVPILCAGCGGSTGDTPPAPAPASSLAAPLQAPPQASGGTDEDEDLPPGEPVPTWDDTARSAAIARAEQAMRAFARPDVDARTWWRSLQPLLSRTGALAYQDTDPQQVPARRVTAAGRLTATPSTYLAQVQVATDVGAYEVLLVREDAHAPWLVERLTPPAGVR